MCREHRSEGLGQPGLPVDQRPVAIEREGVDLAVVDGLVMSGTLAMRDRRGCDGHHPTLAPSSPRSCCWRDVPPGLARSQPPASSGGGPVTTEDEAVARVIAHEPRLAGIAKRDSEMIGQANWYEVAPALGVGAFIVTVRLGWGDCQAGCIDAHTWVYAVKPDGTVTQQSEGGETCPTPLGRRLAAVRRAGPACTSPRSRDRPVPSRPCHPIRDVRPKPVPNVTVAIVDAGEGVQDLHLSLDAAGQGFVALEPGVYTFAAQGVDGFMSAPEAQRVVVEDGRVAEVTFAYDTGIR